MAFQKLRNVKRPVMRAPLERFAKAKRTLAMVAPVKTAMKRYFWKKETAHAEVAKL